MDDHSSYLECHLLVLVHGMWGNPGHLAELNRIITETIPDPTLHVLNAETNKEDSTYDGIDWGGERVAEEIMAEVDKLQKEGRTVTRFSITGYSLGGLVSRYVVGILRQRGFFENVTPVNFNTIATPHLGLARYRSLFSTLASALGPKLLSRTGEQFYCVDRWSAKGRPLIEVMADPDRIFYQALAAFETIRIYANSVNDRTVAYVTAAIELDDIFVARASNGLEIEFDEQYASLISSYSLPPVPPPPTPKPMVLSPSWFKSLKPRRPFLPPFLQFRFPINLVMYTLLPLLIPVFMSLAILRLSLAARSSRARIKLLETDASNSQKLAHILAELEKQVESAVVDFIDDDALADKPAADPERALNKRRSQEQPVLTPTQHRIAAWLNRLPLKKERAYFPNVLNSHAVIICRDVKNFESHRAGAGIVQHWADSFIL
ncbi:putative serine esterase-domain-containing protein [Mycena capillaripes]|nr:putative serine esterase-domain-containing protein [Mycena capillaripes]